MQLLGDRARDVVAERQLQLPGRFFRPEDASLRIAGSRQDIEAVDPSIWRTLDAQVSNAIPSARAAKVLEEVVQLHETVVGGASAISALPGWTRRLWHTEAFDLILIARNPLNADVTLSDLKVDFETFDEGDVLAAQTKTVPDAVQLESRQTANVRSAPLTFPSPLALMVCSHRFPLPYAATGRAPCASRASPSSSTGPSLATISSRGQVFA
jgi:hypothetical protein